MWSCCPSIFKPEVGPKVESDAGEPASPKAAAVPIIAMVAAGLVNGNLKLTPFTLKQQSKIDPFDDLLRLNLWLNSYSLFIF